MESTFLLHKPVSYGSTLANNVFLAILLLHILAGAIAPITATVAITTRGGSKSHTRFGRFVIVIARTTSSSTQNRAAAVVRHRFGMSCLAAFSWWGALQGFGPAIAIAIQGGDSSTSAYMGNQPGSFSPAFFLFLVSWAPFFFLAAYSIRRSTKLGHT